MKNKKIAVEIAVKLTNNMYQQQILEDTWKKIDTSTKVKIRKEWIKITEEILNDAT